MKRDKGGAFERPALYSHQLMRWEGNLHFWSPHYRQGIDWLFHEHDQTAAQETDLSNPIYRHCPQVHATAASTSQPSRLPPYTHSSLGTGECLVSPPTPSRVSLSLCGLHTRHCHSGSWCSALRLVSTARHIFIHFNPCEGMCFGMEWSGRRSGVALEYIQSPARGPQQSMAQGSGYKKSSTSPQPGHPRPAHTSVTHTTPREACCAVPSDSSSRLSQPTPLSLSILSPPCVPPRP
jgi:hypothetical protein